MCLKTATYKVFLVPAGEVLTNELLEDLEKIWALRDIIPDPTNPLCIIKTEGIE